MVFLERNFISADTNRNHFFDWRKLIILRQYARYKKFTGKLDDHKLLRVNIRNCFHDLWNLQAKFSYRISR